jgi:hypothetical protein
LLGPDNEEGNDLQRLLNIFLFLFLFFRFDYLKKQVEYLKGVLKNYNLRIARKVYFILTFILFIFLLGK